VCGRAVVGVKVDVRQVDSAGQVDVNHVIIPQRLPPHLTPRTNESLSSHACPARSTQCMPYTQHPTPQTPTLKPSTPNPQPSQAPRLPSTKGQTAKGTHTLRVSSFLFCSSAYARIQDTAFTSHTPCAPQDELDRQISRLGPSKHKPAAVMYNTTTVRDPSRPSALKQISISDPRGIT
jgi:hypothetical protein